MAEPAVMPDKCQEKKKIVLSNFSDTLNSISHYSINFQCAGPVLLFPEGYCTNNTRVLQFRQAVFDDDINIYPIAIR